MPPPRRLAASPACGMWHWLPTGPREPLAHTRPRLITPSPKTDAGSGSGRRRTEVLEGLGSLLLLSLRRHQRRSCRCVCFSQPSAEEPGFVAGIRGRTGELRSVARPGADVRHLPRFPRCPRVSGPLTEPQAAAVGEPSRRAACQPGRGPQPGRPPARPPGRGQGGPRRPSRLTCLRRGRTPGPTGTRECVTCANKRPASFDICFLS